MLLQSLVSDLQHQQVETELEAAVTWAVVQEVLWNQHRNWEDCLLEECQNYGRVQVVSTCTIPIQKHQGEKLQQALPLHRQLLMAQLLHDQVEHRRLFLQLQLLRFPPLHL